MTPRGNAVAVKVAKKRASPARASDAILRLCWDLAELPSSQHRAGLAGLVLMFDWVARKNLPKDAVCRVVQRGANGAEIELSPSGLKAVFDEVYSASRGEVESATIQKDRLGKPRKPLRREDRREKNKRGEVVAKTIYVYPTTIPSGAFVEEWDKTDDKLWVKLWRDTLWATLRGVPKTRIPFEARANREKTGDAAVAWAALSGEPDASVDLPSSYFIGAMAATAEGAPFRDRARFQFLLHFWPFVAQVYQAVKLDRDGSASAAGYVLVVPDVADLDAFCRELPQIMRDRGGQKRGFRPTEALIEIPAEGGLDVLRRLRGRIAKKVSRLEDLVLAVDVMHLEKRGNNVTLRSSARVPPELSMVDEYERIRARTTNDLYRWARVRNVVARRSWYTGFDEVFETRPYAQTVGSPWFAKDARVDFEEERKRMPDASIAIEQLVYEFVRTYVLSRLESKHELKWQDVKDDAARKQEFNEKKQKIAKDAFLSVRARTGEDFAAYFAGTLGSVPHRMDAERYAALARALKERPGEVRTLTMLALSANA